MHCPVQLAFLHLLHKLKGVFCIFLFFSRCMDGVWFYNRTINCSHLDFRHASPPKKKKRKTCQSADIEWCDNWLLNRTIQWNTEHGKPCPEVELRLSQVPRMLNFMGSFAATNISYIIYLKRLVFSWLWEKWDGAYKREMFFVKPRLQNLLGFFQVYTT